MKCLATGKNNVWIISELYYPEENATGHILTQIAEGLAVDNKVNVLCAQPTYSQRGMRAAKRETRNGVQIHRCRSSTFGNHNLVFRAVNAITISLSLFLMLVIKVGRGDAVFVVTNPPLLPFLVALARCFRRFKSVLVVHDVYPEVAVAAGLLRNDSLLFRMFSALNNVVLRHFNRVIVLGRDMLQVFLQKKNVIDSSLVIITNPSECDRIQPEPRDSNALLNGLELKQRFVLQYAGNMGRTHDMEVWVNVAEKMKALNTHFLFIGAGVGRQYMAEAIKNRGHKNVTLMPYPSREEQSMMLNACDLAIVSFKPLMTGLSVPSRMYNIMAAGKPILAVASAESELAMVVREERIGWVVSPGFPEKVVEAIIEAQSNPQLLREMGERSRRVAENKYSLPTMLNSYKALVKTLWVDDNK